MSASEAIDAVARDDPLELGEDALLGHRRRRPARSCAPARAVAGSTASPSSAARRTRRTTRSGSSANAPGPTARSRRAARSAHAAVRVDARAARQRLGDRVDGEVAQRQVGLQRAAAQRAEVDLPRAVGRHHAPGAELVGQLEHGPARRLRQRARGRRHVALDGDVEVARRAAEHARRAPPRRRARPAGRAGPRRPARAGRSSRAAPASRRAAPSLSRPLPVAVVDARNPRKQPAGDLVVDRLQALRDLLGRDALVALGADQHGRLADRRRRRAPTSSVTLSMLTVPTSGRRRRARARRGCSSGRAAPRRRTRSGRSRCASRVEATKRRP